MRPTGCASEPVATPAVPLPAALLPAAQLPVALLLAALLLTAQLLVSRLSAAPLQTKDLSHNLSSQQAVQNCLPPLSTRHHQSPTPILSGNMGISKPRQFNGKAI
jgi:hypothetical protein